jgi:hypothetical protein
MKRTRRNLPPTKSLRAAQLEHAKFLAAHNLTSKTKCSHPPNTLPAFLRPNINKEYQANLSNTLAHTRPTPGPPATPVFVCVCPDPVCACTDRHTSPSSNTDSGGLIGPDHSPPPPPQSGAARGMLDDVNAYTDADRQIVRKLSKRVAVEYNKGGLQYISEGTDLSKIGRKV